MGTYDMEAAVSDKSSIPGIVWALALSVALGVLAANVVMWAWGEVRVLLGRAF